MRVDFTVANRVWKSRFPLELDSLRLDFPPKNKTKNHSNAETQNRITATQPRKHQRKKKSWATQKPKNRITTTQEEIVIFGFGFLLRLRSWFGFGILRNGFRWRRKKGFRWNGFLGAWKKGRRWWTRPKMEKEWKKMVNRTWNGEKRTEEEDAHKNRVS